MDNLLIKVWKLDSLLTEISLVFEAMEIEIQLPKFRDFETLLIVVRDLDSLLIEVSVRLLTEIRDLCSVLI
jgi:hypothetical protein